MNSSSMTLTARGEASLDERVDPQNENGSWDSIRLLRASADTMGLRVSVESDEDGVWLELSEYHMTSEETGRVFHMNLEIALSREDARDLYRYLGFLLDASVA